MKKWKVLIPLGVVLFVGGGNLDNVMLAGLLAFIGVVLFIVGLWDLKPKKKAEKV